MTTGWPSGEPCRRGTRSPRRGSPRSSRARRRRGWAFASPWSSALSPSQLLKSVTVQNVPLEVTQYRIGGRWRGRDRRQHRARDRGGRIAARRSVARGASARGRARRQPDDGRRGLQGPALARSRRDAVAQRRPGQLAASGRGGLAKRQRRRLASATWRAAIPIPSCCPTWLRSCGGSSRRASSTAATPPTLSCSIWPGPSSARPGSPPRTSPWSAAPSTGSSVPCRRRLRPGDVVAVEDPGFAGLFDLLRALGLALRPVAIDGKGMVPAGARRCARAGRERGGGQSRVARTRPAHRSTRSGRRRCATSSTPSRRRWCWRTITWARSPGPLA